MDNEASTFSSTSMQGFYVGLSTNTSDKATSNDSLMMKVRIDSIVGNSYYQVATADGVAPHSSSTTNFTRKPAVENIWVEIIRMSSTEIKVTQYADSEYTEVLESISATIPSTIVGLRYLKILTQSEASANEWQGTLDDMKFYDGVTSVTSKPTDIQDNSIFVETDTDKRYWFDGSTWTNEVDATYGMYFGGHYGSGYTTEIQRLTIGTSGSVEDFGDITVARGWTMAVADATRGVCAGGGVYSAIIDYVTVAGSVGGTATAWGADLSASREQAGSCCDETHGLFAGGYGTIGGGSSSNVVLATVDHITIQTAGTVTDWGDMQQARYQSAGASTAGVLDNSHGMIFSGIITSSTATTTIQYLPIGTTGTASDFGDCSVIRTDGGAVANTSRAIVVAGEGGSGRKKSMDYFAVGTTGTSGDFGDLNKDLAAIKGANNATYGIFAGGWASVGGLQSAIEYVTIASLGDGSSFGDLHLAVRGAGGCSA